jgi:hypothetical protein
MSDLPPLTPRLRAQGARDESNVPFTRRTVLSGAAAATTAVTVGSVHSILPVLAAGSDFAQQGLKDFIQLSAALTGIDASKLAPDVDPINIKTEYFDSVRTRSPKAFDNLLTFFKSSENNGRFPDDLFEPGQLNAEIRSLARSIILLWYLGSWYDPKALENGDQRLTPQIISSKAYSQAWIWRVAQTHPMGYSEWAFGYWHDDPPPMDSFIKSRPKA